MKKIKNKSFKFIYYCSNSIRGVLAGYIFLICLVHFGVNEVLASALSFLLSYAINFKHQKNKTFKDRPGNHRKQFNQYLFMGFLLFTVNDCGMYLNKHFHLMNYLLAQIILSAVVTVLGWIIAEKIIFKKILR